MRIVLIDRHNRTAGEDKRAVLNEMYVYRNEPKKRENLRDEKDTAVDSVGVPGSEDDLRDVCAKETVNNACAVVVSPCQQARDADGGGA